MSAITVFQPITKLHPQDKPLFSGKTAPEKSLNVCQSKTGLVLAKTTSDKNGSWLVRSSVSLPEGEYSISAYVEGTSVYADNVPFVVEALSSGALPNGSAPTVTSSTTVTTLRPLLKGKATANATVHVYQANGGLFGSAIADKNGDWELQLTQDLSVSASGTSDIALIAYNTAGAPVSGWTSVTLTVNVTSGSTALPSGSAPTVTSSTTVTILRPLLKGKAAADIVVYVYQAGGSTLFGKPTADKVGDWELQLTQDLSVSASDTSDIALIAYNTAGAPVSGWTSVTLTVSRP
ncbi:Ig-like domain-containing protein [Pseudomonas helvetica]|uniref:Ig-like domain-containing protein n=1 Tax=Pseudomonas helvetica TaxID=3136738 RepID=UPI0032678FD5